jgi:hypothetical protein
MPDGTDVRFTRKADSLYVFSLNRPESNGLTVPALRITEGSSVQILGTTSTATISQRGEDAVIQPEGVLPKTYVLVAKITPAPQA